MKLWPRSLQGQLLLAIAIALFVAQGLSTLLLYRSQAERREAALVTTAAFRMAGALQGRAPPFDVVGRRGGGMRTTVHDSSPQRRGETRNSGIERALQDILAHEGVGFSEVVVVERPVLQDRVARQWIARHHRHLPARFAVPPHDMIVAAVRRPDGRWLHTRVMVPAGERRLVLTMIVQALFTYLLLVGAVALVLRRITRPLAALTRRMERFAGTRDGAPPLAPQGPSDIRGLIAAHNALEARIAALLDEKDVMLGAIGHDLKTPLAALRVRIESVAEDAERIRMAETIEDIARTLDDILSLARVGRPSDPLEPTELGALAASVVEEYEDRGEKVTLTDPPRIVLPARTTWLRRALRNLIDNGLRYGGGARVALHRQSGQAVLCVDDDGPGIPEPELARMLEPFTRLDSSRNSATGGSGLGLTLARAIAEQHGGSLTLSNRPDGGLRASISLPCV